MKRNALYTLTEQQWRTIAIEVEANTRRSVARERAIDDYIASGAARGAGAGNASTPPGGRGWPGVVWSQVMSAPLGPSSYALLRGAS